MFTVVSILLQFGEKEMIELIRFHLLKANDIRGILPNFVKNSLFPVFPRERPRRTVAINLRVKNRDKSLPSDRERSLYESIEITHLSRGVFVTEYVVRHTGEKKIGSLPIRLSYGSPRSLKRLTGRHAQVIQHVG